MESQEAVPHYNGNREQLYKEVEQFERILDEETDKIKVAVEGLEAGKRISLEPLQTFETNLAIHNKNNEEILKNKLRAFAERLKKVEKRI